MMPRSANKSSTSRKLEELVSDRESFFDQFDEAGVDFSLGAIPDDEALALAGAPHLRFNFAGGDRAALGLGNDRLHGLRSPSPTSFCAAPAGCDSPSKPWLGGRRYGDLRLQFRRLGGRHTINAFGPGLPR